MCSENPKDEKNNNWEGREAERGNHVIITGYGPWPASSRCTEDKRQFIRNGGWGWWGTFFEQGKMILKSCCGKTNYLGF